MQKVTKTQSVTVSHTTSGGKKLPGEGQDERIVKGTHRLTLGGKPYTESKKEGGDK